MFWHWIYYKLLIYYRSYALVVLCKELEIIEYSYKSEREDKGKQFTWKVHDRISDGEINQIT